MLTAPVLGAVIILSLIASIHAKTIVNDLMAQHLAQIHDQIERVLNIS